MPVMTVREVASACGGRLIATEEEASRQVVGGVTDNRKIEEGNLFFAIVGSRVDAHAFIPQAFAAGAAAVVCEREIEQCAGPLIIVEKTELALAKIAAYYRSLLTIPVIGITGSVGKTSTKEMIASILSEKFRVLKTDGNFNNEIGMPLTLLRIRDHHEVAVVEMGINHFGEMERLSRVAMPDLFVITNIGACHLEFLGDLDGVLKAKTEGLPLLKDKTPVVLNGDDQKLRTLAQDGHIKPLYYGIDSTDGLVYADRITSRGEEGSSFVLHMDKEELDAVVHVPGRHMIMNAMAGALVACELGLSHAQIVSGIAKMQTISGRSNFIHTKELTVIDDCYNANPNSMKASLEVLSNCSGRRIAVLGDMGELGTEEEKLHYEVGAYLADLKLDAVFLSGSLAAALKQGITDHCDIPVFYFADKEALLPKLQSYLEPKDTILVKASHFMGYSQIVDALTKQ